MLTRKKSPFATSVRGRGLRSMLGLLSLGLVASHASVPAHAQATSASFGDLQRNEGKRAEQHAIANGLDPELSKSPVTPGADRVLSPYFFVEGAAQGVEALPLKATSTDVDIAGVIADVQVTQVYQNTGKVPIEARYVFPASTRAAVYGMRMTIGSRTIVAQIERRDEARQQYETAKAQGKSASLLEQQRPNVFEMNVANIMPGDEIRVELSYTELLIPTDGIYEFVYPTVVGPRYSNLTAEHATDTDRFVASPYLKEDQAPAYDFDLTATLSTGIPLQGIGCPSHQVQVSYEAPDRASIVLDSAEHAGGNRDFILRYRLAGGQVQSGVLLYEGKDENYFMVMAQPPRRIAPEHLPGREYVFIVDISGSMNGFPLDVSKQILSELIGSLKPTDTFNVMLFAGSSTVLGNRSLPATDANIQAALDLITRQRGGGSTELLPAMKRALELPRTPGMSRSMVIVTDGYVRVEAEAFDLIRSHLDESNLFAFGIGSSVNRHLMEGMARVGQGEPFIVTDQKEAPAIAARFRRYIESPVLTGVSLGISGLDAYDIDPPSIPDVLAERPIVILGKYRGTPKGEIVLEGMAGEGPYRAAFDVAKVKPRSEHAALRSLWARARVATLADYNQLWQTPARVEEVTRLGLKYSLLTPYTSFVAVDSLVRNQNGPSAQVDQPLPLPEGVGNAAVGGVPASPQRTMLGASTGVGGGGSVGGPSGGVGQGYGSGRGAASSASGIGSVASSERKSAKGIASPMVEVARVGAKSKDGGADAGAAIGGPAGDSSSLPAPARAQAAGEGGASADKKNESQKQRLSEVRVAAVRVEKGSLSAEAARAVVSLHQAQLVALHTKALASDAGLVGSVSARITVAENGRVIKVEWLSPGPALKQSFLNVLARVILEWRFELGAAPEESIVEVKLELATR